jgi:hypothetical protein
VCGFAVIGLFGLWAWMCIARKKRRLRKLRVDPTVTKELNPSLSPKEDIEIGQENDEFSLLPVENAEFSALSPEKKSTDSSNEEVFTTKTSSNVTNKSVGLIEEDTENIVLTSKETSMSIEQELEYLQNRKSTQKRSPSLEYNKKPIVENITFEKTIVNESKSRNTHSNEQDCMKRNQIVQTAIVMASFGEEVDDRDFVKIVNQKERKIMRHSEMDNLKETIKTKPNLQRTFCLILFS